MSELRNKLIINNNGPISVEECACYMQTLKINA